MEEKKNIRTVKMPNSVLLPEIVRLMNEGHTVTLLLKGWSMRPFLEDSRDKGLLKKAENPQIGEPVLAEVSPGRFVLHRLISIKGDDVILLGDGNLLPEYCHLDDIKGVAIGFYRKGRSKLDPVNGWKWKTYSKIWMTLRPIRRYLLALYRRWVRLFGPI